MQTIRRRISGLLLLAAFVFLAVAVGSFAPVDGHGGLPFTLPEKFRNLCGPIGLRITTVLFWGIGAATLLLLIPLLTESVRLLRGRRPDQIPLRLSGCLFVLVGFCGLISLSGKQSTVSGIRSGGELGNFVAGFGEKFVTETGCGIFLASFVVAGLVLCADRLLFRLFSWLTCSGTGRNESESVTFATTSETVNAVHAAPARRTELEAEAATPEWSGLRVQREQRRTVRLERPQPNFRNIEEDESSDAVEYVKPEYALPSVELLKPGESVEDEDLEETVMRQSQEIEKAFADFNVQVKVVDIQTGPVISQFELQLAKGLRLNRVQKLDGDLAIALKVPSVRVVAPIPGKNSVGVELPNEKRQMVRLRDVMEIQPEAADKMNIPIFLGKDVSGTPMVIDLSKLPHLLIAGRTGTGKSVCLNSIIVSILMTRSPEEVRMLMIDPKMVELSPYGTIPHLMHPVVTDMRKAEAILGWAVEKMEERYQLLAAAGVRQLSEYNAFSEQDLRRRMKMRDASDEDWAQIPKKLPYIVTIIDEMGDLMMTMKDAETHIIRLAQKSRAVGIHLVLATQKPTVDVVTGLIKSNLPARIAFGVATKTDSIVVLDRVGAERLLGHGDMLFLQPGTSDVVRGQGTFIGNDEIESIIDLIGTDEPDFVDELVELNPDENEESAPVKGRGSKAADDDGGKVQRDDVYFEAVEFIIQEGRGSLSLLQRRFGVGYSRAARMIDFMAEDGVVGPYKGSKPREVITTLGAWKRKRAKDTSTVAIKKDVPIKPLRPKYIEPEFDESDGFEDDDDVNFEDGYSEEDEDDGDDFEEIDEPRPGRRVRIPH